MSDDFRERYANFIVPYRERKLSSDQIYEDAHLRQLKLVSLCFDVCLTEVAKRKEYDCPGIYKEGMAGPQLLTAADFCPAQDIASLTPEQQQATRKRLTNFLEQKCDVLIILDGNVKGRARFDEKVAEAPDAAATAVNDINRLTVASKDLQLIDAFAHGLAAKLPAEEICAKNEWDYKKFGMLSRSNYVMIDGVPAEIHLNEPQQLLVSRTVTHHVYEVMRESDQLKFNRAFYALPETIRDSVASIRTDLSPTQANTVDSLQDQLVTSLIQNANGSANDKLDCLTEFHRDAHEAFIKIASPEWQTAFMDAKSRHISSLARPAKPNTPASIKVTERLKQG